MTLLEPDVALTDFALAIECGWFAAWLFGRRAAIGRHGPAFIAFFTAVGIAALLGGISHGFLPDHQSALAGSVWAGTLIAIGAAAFSSWVAGARLCLSDVAAMRLTLFAAVLFLTYVVVVAFISRSFAVAIMHYLPAAAFLMLAFALAYRGRRAGFFLAGIAGVALTFTAAGVQYLGMGLHSVYFNHNALYHLIQAVGLLLIFWTARGLTKASAM
jgi:hypothetical protein